jgi:hypothetical protein
LEKPQSPVRAPIAVDPDPELSLDDDTSDDLDLMNPLTIPKPLEVPARSFRMSDSDGEPVDDSFLMRSTREEKRLAEAKGAEEIQDSPVRLSHSISRLARELRDAATEVHQVKRKRRLEFGDLGTDDSKRPGKAYFRELSDLDDSGDDAPAFSPREDGLEV